MVTKNEHTQRLERALRAHERKQNKPRVGPLCLFALLVAAIVWFFWWNKRDLADAPVQTVTTTVTSAEPTISQNADERNGRDGRTKIMFRTAAQVQGVRVTRNLPWRLPVGERVTVTFRKGKSGGLYVEGMAPETPPKR